MAFFNWNLISTPHDLVNPTLIKLCGVKDFNRPVQIVRVFFIRLFADGKSEVFRAILFPSKKQISVSLLRRDQALVFANSSGNAFIT